MKQALKINKLVLPYLHIDAYHLLESICFIQINIGMEFPTENKHNIALLDDVSEYKRFF